MSFPWPLLDLTQDTCFLSNTGSLGFVPWEANLEGSPICGEHSTRSRKDTLFLWPASSWGELANFQTWVVVLSFIHLGHVLPLFQFERFLVHLFCFLSVRVHENVCLNFKIFSFAWIILGWFMLCILRSVVPKLLETLFTWYLTEESSENLQIMEYLPYFPLFGLEKKLPLPTLGRLSTARRPSPSLFSKSLFPWAHFIPPKCDKLGKNQWWVPMLWSCCCFL